MNCHMVFDVKMEDFRRKARLVAGGHMTEAPPTVTYASVVSRETDRLALTPEFGPDAGKTAIIVTAMRRKFLSCRPT